MPRCSPTMPSAPSFSTDGGGANLDSWRVTSSGGANKCMAAAASQKSGGGGTGGGSGGGGGFVPEAMLSSSSSISRARLARVWITATGSRQPESVPAEMTRFWSTGLMARRMSAASPCSQRSLALMKASNSSFVAGFEIRLSSPIMPRGAGPTPWPRPICASISLAFLTLAWMTAVGSRTLDIVPALMTRRWSTALMFRRICSASSGSHRLFCPTKASSSSRVAGFTGMPPPVAMEGAAPGGELWP
mmetsp:Transcript_84009/g.246415  ORF Transcript_84009/g.246415 Transcript_84009/m.246415 type:complete len:246 (+) Transcript_84009:1883-2620(+)